MPFLKLYILLLVFTAAVSGNTCGNKSCSCENNGTCIKDIECIPYCQCPPGFFGESCHMTGIPSIPIIIVNCSDVCSSRPCGNGGNCSQEGYCDSKCNCPSRYSGKYCEVFCDPSLCVHGHCNNTESNDVTCNCDDNWSGKTCNISCPQSNCTVARNKVPQEDDNYLIPVLLTMAVIVLIFMVLTYFMWKKRMVFLMKIVFKFQNYEDDDGKEYDAFVSYRSAKSDEDWVFKTLFPMLETEMGFKICVHFKDFLLGETISNNIINAIEKSRRTILVLSPDYIAGEWTKMEYQVAQQEMLKRRQKIIPILFRDISNVENIDKNLTYILNSITYIKWPEDGNTKKLNHFWEQLRLTMPKKNELNNTIEGGNVTNVWTVDTNL